MSVCFFKKISFIKISLHHKTNRHRETTAFQPRDQLYFHPYCPPIEKIQQADSDVYGI